MALADNKVKIQALLDGINALPEAGGGGAVETCTVTRTTNTIFVYYVDENGVAQVLNERNDVMSVVCAKNTLVTVYDSEAMFPVSVSGGEKLVSHLFDSMYWFGRATSDIIATI